MIHYSIYKVNKQKSVFHYGYYSQLLYTHAQKYKNSFLTFLL